MMMEKMLDKKKMCTSSRAKKPKMFKRFFTAIEMHRLASARRYLHQVQMIRG